MHTPPYTGGPKQAFRDISIQDIFQMQQRIKDTVFGSEFYAKRNTKDYNHYLRGELHITIDAILSIDIKVETYELVQLLEFLDQFILFIVGYIRKLPDFIPLYIEALTKEPWMYLVSKEVSYVSSFPEIFDCFLNITGGNGRT
jgi:hypothetical protein